MDTAHLRHERLLRRRRARRAAFSIAFGTVLVLGIALGAVVAADFFVRGLVERAVASQLKQALSIRTVVDVKVEGVSVLAQVITGRLEKVTATAERVHLGELAGRAEVVARGVPFDSGMPVSDVRLEFSVAEEDLPAISSNLSGLPISTVTVERPNVKFIADFDVLGVPVPLGVGLAPAPLDGAIAFTPTSIRLGDAEITADALRGQFGPLAEAALATQNLCIAESLPVALRLTGIDLPDGEFVLQFRAQDVELDDPRLGTCTA